MTDTQKDQELNNTNAEKNPTQEAPQSPQPPINTDAKPQKRKNTAVIIMAIITTIAVLISVVTVFAFFFGVPYFKYNSAINMMEEKEYDKAMVAFSELNGFMDSEEKYKECQYIKAVKLCEAGKYTDAMEIFDSLGDYNDSKDLITECRYQSALLMIEENKCDEAINILEELGDYKESKDKINECNYKKACDMMEEGSYDKAQTMFESLGSYKDSKDQIKECQYKTALKLIDDGKIVEAYKALNSLGSYKESKKKLNSIKSTYLRILAKDNIFINKMWIPPSGKRCQIISSVIDENTMEFKYTGSASLMEHTEETIIATWDETNGTLTYSGSTCFMNYSTGMQDVLYTDGSGYFYYQNGYLYHINNKSDPEYNTTYYE